MSLQFTLGLIIGAAAGAAVVHFLNTAEGRAFATKLKNDAANAEEELSELAEEVIKKGRTFVNELELG